MIRCPALALVAALIPLACEAAEPPLRGRAILALTAHQLTALELKPSLTKLVKPDKAIGSFLISDPEVAEVTIMNLDTIAVTGKRTGTANLVLLDESGALITNMPIQVVPGPDYKEGAAAPLRREIRVTRFGKGDEILERNYLCAPDCARVSSGGSEPASKR
jgi:Flp pilus assembly secretin CpaC